MGNSKKTNKIKNKCRWDYRQESPIARILPMPMRNSCHHSPSNTTRFALEKNGQYSDLMWIMVRNGRSQEFCRQPYKWSQISKEILRFSDLDQILVNKWKWVSRLKFYQNVQISPKKMTFLHFLWSELESSLCTGLWFSNIEWKDCWVQFFENVKKLSLLVSVSSHLNIVLRVNYASHPKLQLNPPRRKAT